jgi:hypothetical protein
MKTTDFQTSDASVALGGMPEFFWSPPTGGTGGGTGGSGAGKVYHLAAKPVWFATKWDSLVRMSVHAPMAASRTGPRNVNLLASSKFARPLTAPLGPAIPNLWVENGVIWQLPNLLVGFTSYPAATVFFSSVKGFGYEPAPSSWYEGTPFSASDFPILHWGKKGVEINGFILVWPSLNAISFAKIFLPMLPVNQPLIPSPATSAGPVVPTSAVGNFSADSPTGVQTFQAQYIMYAPFGPSPLSGIYTSAPGIQYDMILYSWWYSF